VKVPAQDTRIIGATSGEQLFLHQDRPAEMPAYLFGRNMSEKALGSSITSPQSSRREVVDYINRALETADIAENCRAIGTVARLYNISDLAHRSGIERGSVYRAFAGDQSIQTSSWTQWVSNYMSRDGTLARGQRG
jgi:probable addiction module antidote protein